MTEQRENWQDDFRKWAAGLNLSTRHSCIHLPERAVTDAALAQLIAKFPGQLLIVTADSSEADRLRFTLGTFMQILADSREVIVIPEVITTRHNQWQPENEAERCAALETVLRHVPAIFVASVSALLAPAMTPQTFSDSVFSIHIGDTNSPPEELARRLVTLDYDNEYEVHMPGEFSRRGGIVDLFSPLCDAPVRIEYFGDTVDSMRYFLPEDQRSFRNVELVRIAPRGAILHDGQKQVYVHQYFASDTPLAVCDPTEIDEHLAQYATPGMRQHWQQATGQAQSIVELVSDPAELDAAAQTSETAILRTDCIGLGAEIGPMLPELGEGAALWHWQLLRDHLLRWHKQQFAIVACCGGEGEIKRFQELLHEDEATRDLPVQMNLFPLDTGILIPSARLVMLSEKELFGRRPDLHRRRKSRYKFDYTAQEEFALTEGGYAVHAAHGICIYHGIRELEVTGELQEVMELEFDEGARLYVPLDQAHLVSRYVGGTKKYPQLSRLGSSSWKNKKESAAAAAWDLAAELLRLEALRQSSRGFAFQDAVDWEKSFAASFPYTETEDQAQAIQDVLQDMRQEQPMDRLLCGDVGYGKTEVAMRAAFRAIVNSKQVAVLVPTTILAQQHFITFRERMAEYPVEIEMLSRFRTAAEQKQILEKLALGQIDVIIGTHRLLQKDIQFNDLGLVIIDEEQRFGVQHKQKFKHLRSSVDILTMTATPIPRTLYFSLAGIRNLSTIMTAPAERLPITTIVAQYDRELIRQAVRRELERHGQVFFLHNRVQTIDKVAKVMQELMPEADCGIAHGQMAADELEENMSRFINGDINVLICTTIIESGLDIPNANTLIVDRADRFGLAELYQLRGRVGRYHNQAYAYLLLPPMGSMPKNARERLTAIRRYTHLGAGFKLALRDLEIRGAGNILGTEQSGHIAAVGFELYCKLLKDAVARLENAPSPARRQIPVTLDNLVFGLQDRQQKACAAFPPYYMQEEKVRLESYRRLSELLSTTEVDAFATELEDRFGRLPNPVRNLLDIARIRILAAEAGIFSLRVRDRQVFLETERGLKKDSNQRLPTLDSSLPENQLQELQQLLRRQRKETSASKASQ